MNTLFNHDQIVYSLDTSSLIDAYRKLYPMDNFPSLWQDIENLIRQDRLIMSEFVFAEAMRDKFLDDWCTNRKLKSQLELKIDDFDQIAVRDILAEYPGILNLKKGKSLSDPWVIAVAKRYFQNVVIVSEEKLTGNLQHPRIPDVCKDSNIECVTISGMIQREDWKY